MGPPHALLSFSLLFVSCSSVDRVGTLIHEDGPDSPAPLISAPAELLQYLVATQGADLVVVDPETGDIVARRPAPSPGAPLDLSVGPARDGSVWIAGRTTQDEDLGGEQLLFSFDETSGLSEPRSLGRIEGSTATLALPFGVVVAQADMGERWRLLPAIGGFTPSVACGLPRSVRHISDDASGVRVEALSFWPENQLSLLDVTIAPDRVVRCDAKAVVGMPPPSDGIRLVELGVGYSRALADVIDEELVISALDGEEVVSTGILKVISSRLVSIERREVEGGVATLVMLGAEPTVVAVVDVRLDDGAITAALRELHRIDASIGPASRALGGFLATISGDIFVATEEGVVVIANEDPPVLPDGLRGPIAAITIE
ncbi:MAG: hypothetical protein HOV80_13285 [Polyangiaceae bacterium]|nr:hypothetical protein [Polyangiaceae bacterium]